MKPRRHRSLGQSLVEFTLVGIPIVFVLISIFEISRGMWMFHTLAYAAKAGIRYATVHGFNCTQSPNACSVTIGPYSNNTADCTTVPPSSNLTLATVIWCAGVGLDPDTTQLTFTDGLGVKTTCYLSACTATPNPWPPASANLVGYTISVQITAPFKSALAMFWPGARPVSFTQTLFPASSSDTIKF
jgi:Flp pilus assembly protein TadG